MLFLATAFSGWATALLFGVGAGVPYYVRSVRGTSLRPHYGIGLLLPAAALAHAWLPMASIPIRRFDPAGLWLATAALILMVAQAALGLALRPAAGATRGRLRRVHFVSMALIALLIAVHIARNR
jgi:hypothetical protein